MDLENEECPECGTCDWEEHKTKSGIYIAECLECGYESMSYTKPECKKNNKIIVTVVKAE